MNNILLRLYLKFLRQYYSIKYRFIAITRGSFISFKATLNISPKSKLFIGKGIRVMPGVIISLHENSILHLNEKSWIGPGTIIYSSQNISIGKNVRIAHYCSIVDHDYLVHSSDKFSKRFSAPIFISDDVWLGASCIILKGVNIGPNSIIAAGTTITKNINANSVVYKKNDLIIKDIVINDHV